MEKNPSFETKKTRVVGSSEKKVVELARAGGMRSFVETLTKNAGLLSREDGCGGTQAKPSQNQADLGENHRKVPSKGKIKNVRCNMKGKKNAITDLIYGLNQGK